MGVGWSRGSVECASGGARWEWLGVPPAGVRNVPVQAHRLAGLAGGSLHCFGGIVPCDPVMTG